MKWWYHLIAGVAGFALAGLIVFLVFGRADQNTQPGGAAPSPVGQASDACGTVQPANITDAATIAAARRNLPTIQVGGKVIVPGRADQQLWFARLAAASGLCVDEIDVTAAALTISTSYGSGVPLASADTFTYATLTRAFDRPLNRNIVKIDTVVNGSHRLVALTASAWHNFQSARALHHLPASIHGLKASRRQVDYGHALIMRGW